MDNLQETINDLRALVLELRKKIKELKGQAGGKLDLSTKQIYNFSKCQIQTVNIYNRIADDEQ